MLHLRIAALAAAMDLSVTLSFAQTPCPARVNVANGECGATVAAGDTVTVTTAEAHRYQRIVNSGTGDLWCTRDIAATPTANGASSFLVTSEEFSLPLTGFVPPSSERCFSAAGTTISATVN